MKSKNKVNTKRTECNEFKQIKWLFVIIFVLICWGIGLNAFIKTKVPKRRLVEDYKVDKKTFNKWIKYFCTDVISDYDAFLKQRKLSLTTYNEIINTLGDVNEYPVLSKKQIIEQADGTYHSLRESIRDFPQQFGISIDVFSRLHKFPPKISKQILMQYD